MRLILLPAVSLFFMTSPALHAQEVGDYAVGLGVSSYGVSLHGEYTTSPQWNVRGVVMGGFSIKDTFEEDDYTVDGNAELGGAALFADYYPMANAWRISGGLFFSASELTGDFVGPENFTGELGLTNKVAPVITTGFRKDVSDTVAIYGDLGIILSSLEVSSNSTDADVQSDIDELNDTLSDVPVLPYIETGLSFRF